MISKQEAERIALEQMPQAELSGLDLTTDKGLALYEGTLQQDDREYTFEIDAETGLVLNMAEAGADSAEEAGKTQASSSASAAQPAAGEIGPTPRRRLSWSLSPSSRFSSAIRPTMRAGPPISATARSAIRRALTS